MAKVNTNISIDSNLKKEAIQLFSEFGLDLSSAITLFLQQSVREQRIPFEIKKLTRNEETLKSFLEFEDMKKDKEKYKRYSSLSEILEELDSADDSEK
ncbi:MAG: type II toxin-antitoxin system RelB/DinJ family antitoxin [Bacilli bacterium]|nr:type II toxin-antitoxin system RelB/DinJ family antitoxin [Bacilli bacterium]MBR1582000.1 type II toxin-antitoxin system RelB/DinJ family antitoxin [Bacilli bacterium]